MTPALDEIKDKLSVSIWATIYVFALSGLYSFAFWRPFGLQPFTFYAVQDVVTFGLGRTAYLAVTPVILAVAAWGMFYWGALASAKWLRVLMAGSVGGIFAKQFIDSIEIYDAHTFHFGNELSIIVVAGILFAGALALFVRAAWHRQAAHFQILALAAVQGATMLAAGYSDGKGIYEGAPTVFFLENRALCDGYSPREWLHVATLGERSIFMNTIDKRICFTNETDFVLVSRKRSEGL